MKTVYAWNVEKMTEPEIRHPEDRDGFMGLRETVADGQIDDQEYTITKNIASGHISVEFESDDGLIEVTYNLGDFVRDAYARVYDDE